MRRSVESLSCIWELLSNLMNTDFQRRHQWRAAEITVAIKPPLMAELKICSPADTALGRRTYSLVWKNTSSFVSVSSSARGHHICDNHESRLHLSSELKHSCTDPYYLQLQKDESFKTLSALENGVIHSFASLTMLAPIKLLHGRSHILESGGNHLC